MLRQSHQTHFAKLQLLIVQMAEEVGFDAETEMIEVSVDLYVASMAFEEGNRRAYLDHLRKAQAHLTGLILDAEEHAAPE
ncbi:MAG: hypothetical protein JRM82_03630 [Nitrososphaerota archaeon]|nr:hypothetical protein [Nitrososphaerota archaeon]